MYFFDLIIIKLFLIIPPNIVLSYHLTFIYTVLIHTLIVTTIFDTYQSKLIIFCLSMWLIDQKIQDFLD